MSKSIYVYIYIYIHRGYEGLFIGPRNNSSRDVRPCSKWQWKVAFLGVAECSYRSAASCRVGCICNILIHCATLRIWDGYGVRRWPPPLQLSDDLRWHPFWCFCVSGFTLPAEPVRRSESDFRRGKCRCNQEHIYIWLITHYIPKLSFNRLESDLPTWTWLRKCWDCCILGEVSQFPIVSICQSDWFELDPRISEQGNRS